MTASMIPVARPFSTGRVGAGTDAAGVVGLASVPAAPACLICGAPAVPGDDLALCQAHGGLGPEWADFDERLWLAGREAC